MRFKLIKTSVATFALFVASFAADAAELPVKAAPYYKGPVRSVVSYYNWTGFYVGAVAGYGFGDSVWDPPFDVNPKPKGMMFGATVGYNWQAGSIVYGLEADYSWSNVKGAVDCGVEVVSSCETANSFLATFRGRIGYAFDRFLPYLTAGGAYGDIKANVTTGPVVTSASKSNLGYTFGAGIEYAIFGNWSTKLEYLYVDLGKFDTGFTAPTPHNVSFKENIIRAGLNYKFSGPIFSRF
jgi:outer membrane immunogenic protein